MDGAWPYVLTALGAAMLPLLWALHAQRQRQLAQQQAAAERAHWQQVFDALDIGLLVFDADDRVRQWNVDYERLYPALDGQIRAGQSFEDMLRIAIARGAVPEARGHEDAWVAERVTRHRRPQAPILRRMHDGRWRRITERYLPDGGMVSYSIDVTELVEQGHALQAAQQEAAAAKARLQDAIEILPAGVELYDADDRLLLANRHMRAMFPKVVDLLDRHPTFEQIVRANHAAGALPNLPSDIDTWIAHRLATRRAAQGAEHVLHVDGRWLRVVEQRTRDGGLIGVRVDISAEMAEREAAQGARRQLEDAIDALPDGFALYDRDDRLVLCNERYRTLYRESAPALQPGARFEDVLRYGLAHGQYPQAAGREEAWLAERLRAHREPGPPLLQELPGNRWLRIDERRTRDGGIAGVRADVTALVRREQALEQVNRDLDRANARLAELLGQDPETGVATATSLQRALEAEWARSRRHGTPLTVLTVTLDTLPEGEGGAAPPMAALARALAPCARRPGDLLARTGDTRLALLLPHTGHAALPALLERCREACREAAGRWPLQVTAAASDTPPPPASPEALQALSEADPPAGAGGGAEATWPAALQADPPRGGRGSDPRAVA